MASDDGGRDKIPTDGGQSISHNPFAGLRLEGLAPASAAPVVPAAPALAPPSLKLRQTDDVGRRSLGEGGPPSQKLGRTGVSGRGSPGEGGPLSPPRKNRGRVDILRETQDRGGKTVTVAANFVGIGTVEKERLAREIRTACGCGGTVKDGRILIQGDQREKVAQILAAAGFRPVFAGG
jgi:translation initiation factor 1